MSQVDVTLSVNGVANDIKNVDDGDRLVDVLRERLGLTGTKKYCQLGVCGACTVLINGQAVNSCSVLAVDAVGKEILTIEGLADEQLHPVQEAFVEKNGLQCGYCTPGMVLSTVALLEENEDPTEEEIRRALVGNICRCTGYEAILDAVELARDKMKILRSCAPSKGYWSRWECRVPWVLEKK